MKRPVSKSRADFFLAFFTLLPLWVAGSSMGSSPEGSDSEIVVQTRAEPGEISIGDLVNIFIDVEHQPGLNVQFPGDPGPLDPFEVRSIEQLPVTQAGARVTSHWGLVVSTFETGTQTFPGIELTVSNGSIDPFSVKSESVQLQVKSVLPEEAEDILDVKSPLEIARAWWTYWPWPAALLLLTLLLCWFWSHHRKATSGPPAAVPLIPPEEEALASLHSLETSDFLGQGQVQLFYTKLSEILRRYLWRRFRIVALEATTSEIVLQLSEAGGAALSAPAGSILRECDLVKFARWKPPLKKRATAIYATIRLVEKGRPVPAPEGSRHEAAGETC